MEAGILPEGAQEDLLHCPHPPPCPSMYVSPDFMTCCGLPHLHPCPWPRDPHEELKFLLCSCPSHEEAQDTVKNKGITRSCPLCISHPGPYQRWLVENYDWGFLISFPISIMTSGTNKILRASSVGNQCRAHSPHLDVHSSLTHLLSTFFIACTVLC